MKLSEKIYEQRKRLNLSQEALGDKLEVTRQSISKWESDQATPELDKLIQMAAAFGISLDELINDKPFESILVTPKQETPEPSKNQKSSRSRFYLFIFILITAFVLNYWLWSMNKILQLENDIINLQDNAGMISQNIQVRMDNLMNMVQDRIMTASELLTDYSSGVESVDMQNKIIIYKLTFLVRDETNLNSIIFTAVPKAGNTLTLKATTDGSGNYAVIMPLDMAQKYYTVSARFNYQDSIKNQSFGFFTGNNILNPNINIYVDSAETNPSTQKATLFGLRLNANDIAFMDGEILLPGDMILQIKDDHDQILFEEELDIKIRLDGVDFPGLSTNNGLSYPLSLPKGKIELKMNVLYTFSVKYVEEDKEPVILPIGTLMATSEGFVNTGKVY